MEKRKERIVRKEGEYIFSEDGREVMEMIQQWWVIKNGNRKKEIMDEIRKEREDMEKIILEDLRKKKEEEIEKGIIEIEKDGIRNVLY